MSRFALATNAEEGSTAAASAYRFFVSRSLPLTMRRFHNTKWDMDQFSLNKKVYEGKSSVVYTATDIQSETPVAIKLYKKKSLSTLNKFQVEREINIHIGLEHENIIKLYAAFEDDKNFYMVQELASGGDLFHKIQLEAGGYFHEEKLVKNVISSFLDALGYLHLKGIAHRDIKPENILLTTEGVVKLADFGLAIDLNEEIAVTRAGTLDYMAPEVFACPNKTAPDENKSMKDISYSTQVDVWAVGILAYELLVGYPPFEKDSRMKTYESIMSADPEFPAWVSPNAREFILAALSKDSSSRPNVRQLSRLAWLQGHAKAKARRGSTGKVPTGYLGDLADMSSVYGGALAASELHFTPEGLQIVSPIKEFLVGKTPALSGGERLKPITAQEVARPASISRTLVPSSSGLKPAPGQNLVKQVSSSMSSRPAAIDVPPADVSSGSETNSPNAAPNSPVASKAKLYTKFMSKLFGNSKDADTGGKELKPSAPKELTPKPPGSGTVSPGSLSRSNTSNLSGTSSALGSRPNSAAIASPRVPPVVGAVGRSQAEPPKGGVTLPAIVSPKTADPDTLNKKPSAAINRK